MKVKKKRIRRTNIMISSYQDYLKEMRRVSKLPSSPQKQMFIKALNAAFDRLRKKVIKAVRSGEISEADGRKILGG